MLVFEKSCGGGKVVLEDVQNDVPALFVDPGVSMWTDVFAYGTCVGSGVGVDAYGGINVRTRDDGGTSWSVEVEAGNFVVEVSALIFGVLRNIWVVDRT